MSWWWSCAPCYSKDGEDIVRFVLSRCDEFKRSHSDAGPLDFHARLGLPTRRFTVGIALGFKDTRAQMHMAVGWATRAQDQIELVRRAAVVWVARRSGAGKIIRALGEPDLKRVRFQEQCVKKRHTQGT